MSYYCYLIKSKSSQDTYIGITDNLQRRLRQHNSEIKGGAKATRKHKDWEYIKTVLLKDRSTALKFEYQAKRSRGLNNRINRLQYLELLFCSPREEH